MSDQGRITGMATLDNLRYLKRHWAADPSIPVVLAGEQYYYCGRGAHWYHGPVWCEANIGAGTITYGCRPHLDPQGHAANLPA